jgi:hypothetical protein
MNIRINEETILKIKDNLLLHAGSGVFCTERHASGAKIWWGMA